MLEVRGLDKTYPNGVRALKNVNFTVRKGEFLVVIGLSGSGKSTLLRCINRLHDPTTGEIIFEGQDIAPLHGENIRRIRCNIGMIFQHFNLIPRHTVLSNVLMGSLGHLSSWRSILGLFSEEDKKKALQYLELVGIADKALIPADQLSGGQQQRVAIARALMQNPRLLLADEPVASLDPATCHTVMDYLKKVNEELGITIIANLHFLSLVRQYATRVIALKAGEIVYEGTPQDITDEWFQRIYGQGAKEVHIS
ncbi:phosphonate ABC transporter ATP-binding protein [Bdellovibrio sp.]|uniref:phosphonate ABC transporter ATP-binding protein n=1 Tax=Bdellovibrio sp. TaxID=28201 RepID=UPI0039E452A8